MRYDHLRFVIFEKSVDERHAAMFGNVYDVPERAGSTQTTSCPRIGCRIVCCSLSPQLPQPGFNRIGKKSHRYPNATFR